MANKLIVLGFWFLLVGCAKNVVTKKSPAELAEYSEDLTVFVPKYSEPKPVKTSTSQKIKVLDSPAINAISEGKNDTQMVEEKLKQLSEYNSKISDGQGFRIQVFAGNSKIDFENTRSYLLRYHHNLQLYESFSQPTYRIKVGDFLTRSEAETHYNALKGKFETARIINDKIDIKKARN
jgi:SPOR domain